MRQIAGVIGSLFIPGFGQAVAGRPRRAALWCGALALCVASVWWSVWALGALAVVGVASAVDAAILLRSTRLQTEPQWMYGLALFGGAVVFSLCVRMWLVEAFKVPSSSMCPTLCTGDHLFVDKLAPHLHEVAHGDVILFRQPCEPDRDYLKRVVATAGETVEVRCHVVYVNGVALASRLVNEAAQYGDRDEATGQLAMRDATEYEETNGGTYRVFHERGRPAHDREADTHDFPLREGNEPPHCPSENAGPGGQLPGTLVVTKPADQAGPCEPQLHYVVPPGHVFTLGDNRSNSNDSRYWGAVPLANVKGRAYGIWAPWSRFGSID